MSDYTRVYNLTVKDNLPTGNSGKVIKGTELDTELNAVAAAIASKADSNSPTFTGTPLAPTASYGTSTTQIATTAFVQAALQALYPVGSVYINASSTTNPSTLLGFGTWVSVGDGKVLVNQDTADGDFDVLGETGGSKSSVSSHTHTFTTGTESATHTHSASTSTEGNHSHTFYSSGGSSGPRDQLSHDTNASNTYLETTSTAGAHSHTVTVGTESANHTHSGTTASTGTSNGNLQPYVTVKMWRRVS